MIVEGTDKESEQKRYIVAGSIVQKLQVATASK